MAEPAAPAKIAMCGARFFCAVRVGGEPIRKMGPLTDHKVEEFKIPSIPAQRSSQAGLC